VRITYLAGLNRSPSAASRKPRIRRRRSTRAAHSDPRLIRPSDKWAAMPRVWLMTVVCSDCAEELEVTVEGLEDLEREVCPLRLQLGRSRSRASSPTVPRPPPSSASILPSSGGPNGRPWRYESRRRSTTDAESAYREREGNDRAWSPPTSHWSKQLDHAIEPAELEQQPSPHTRPRSRMRSRWPSLGRRAARANAARKPSSTSSATARPSSSGSVFLLFISCLP
jgi:hypothetical protein